MILLLDPLPNLVKGIERDVLAARRLSGSMHSRYSNASGNHAGLSSRHMTDAEAFNRTLIPMVYDHSFRISFGVDKCFYLMYHLILDSALDMIRVIQFRIKYADTETSRNRTS